MTDRLLSAPAPAPVTYGPVFDGWCVETGSSGVLYARRTLERPLERHEVLAGLTRYLVAHGLDELIRLVEGQRHIAEYLQAGTPLPVCPYCGCGQGEAPLIVTADESSVTVERCAQSHRADGCGHARVEWTNEFPLPDGACCRDCGTWWRLDLIPDEVAARLNDGIPPAESIQRPADDRKLS
ncbi:hypothetical protein [Streptosporangium sp. NPDC023615]|uniref:hypothetical protein n=1 Tax=Streptosporangium sp. NPDC023615 TaxID=3154794 RepID=UPI003416026A